MSCTSREFRGQPELAPPGPPTCSLESLYCPIRKLQASRLKHSCRPGVWMWRASFKSGSMLLLLSVLLVLAANPGYSVGNASCGIQLAAPEVILASVTFDVDVTLPPFLGANETIPTLIFYTLLEKGANTSTASSTPLHTRNEAGKANLHFKIQNAEVHSVGYHTLELYVSQNNDSWDEQSLLCDPQELHLLAIPAAVTILPPIITAIVAIVFRQVIIALLIGIWLAAFFANKYNPLTAILRALDTYMVGAIASSSNAAIIITIFFLGGLIGVTQKSGGAIGLAKFLNRFAGSRRRASLVCMLLCLLIFFDDYSCVLIAGNSLRSVMNSVGVSKDKFAFIVQSIGPTLPSVLPISSWVGVEVGYVQKALEDCSGGDSMNPFLIVLRSIPFRFFPLLVIYSVVLVCVLGRDFGPMLTAERCSQPPPPLEASPSTDIELTPPNSEDNTKDFTGPLAPKPDKPFRWVNAAVPFAVVTVVTLVGMVLGGRQAILDLPPDQRAHTPMSILNLFRFGNAISALIWASALAVLVLLVMLLVQRILSLKEIVEAWLEGIKDVVEPLMVLILAWALGSAIGDIQTSNFIANSLRHAGLSVGYLPAIVTLIGFFMAFATGSAFGTMGILFPLVIPTTCQLTEPSQREAAVVQTTAAILSSSIFGNVISPIADITILTTAATRCNLVSHIKTAILYVLLAAGISLLFGSLGFGAGWWPCPYSGWLVMLLAVTLMFVLFSASGTSHTSRSLCQRLCPCLCVIPGSLARRAKNWLGTRCFRRAKAHTQEESPEQPTGRLQQDMYNEKTPLLTASSEGLTHRSNLQ